MVCIGCFIPWGLSELGTPIGQAQLAIRNSVAKRLNGWKCFDIFAQVHIFLDLWGQRWGWCLGRDGKVRPLWRCQQRLRQTAPSNEKQVGKRVSTASFRWHPDKQVSVIVILKYWLTATWAQASNLDHCIRSGEMQPECCSAWTAECSLTSYLICSNVNPAWINHWAVESGYIPLT